MTEQKQLRKQTVAIYGQYPHLDEVHDQLEALEQETKRKIDFLKQQATEVRKDAEKRGHPIILEAERRAQEIGLLPAWFDTDTCQLRFNDENKVYVVEECGCDGHMPEELRSALEKLGLSK